MNSKPVALLIEDNEGVATIWRNSLLPLDMEIRWSASLADGIALCRKIPPPCLILLDLRLEDSDAIHTIKAIATLQNIAPNAMIMVISGFITPELGQLAIANGAHAVHEKLSMQRYQDLWNSIQVALNKAPTNVQTALSYTNNLIKQLTQALHVL